MAVYKILKDSELINTIVADEDFCKIYCSENGYEYELVPETPEGVKEPTQLDRIEAQVTYTAMMTDTLLEV